MLRKIIVADIIVETSYFYGVTLDNLRIISKNPISSGYGRMRQSSTMRANAWLYVDNFFTNNEHFCG